MSFWRLGTEGVGCPPPLATCCLLFGGGWRAHQEGLDLLHFLFLTGWGGHLHTHAPWVSSCYCLHLQDPKPPQCVPISPFKKKEIQRQMNYSPVRMLSDILNKRTNRSRPLPRLSLPLCKMGRIVPTLSSSPVKVQSWQTLSFLGRNSQC